jgi:septum formation protein
MAPLLYLASGSPRRSQLLTEAGIAFERFVAPVDEEQLSEAYTGPLALLGEYLATCKATAAFDALHPRHGEALVLASDTTVLLEGHSLAKPRDPGEAEAMLRELRGREHIVATGVALAGPWSGDLITGSSETRVLMRDYSDEEIAAYVATGDPLDKAGAYSIQHPDFHPVETINGCRLGVMGLPVCLVSALIGHWPSLAAMIFSAQERLPICPWSTQCHAPLPAVTALHRLTRGDESAT